MDTVKTVYAVDTENICSSQWMSLVDKVMSIRDSMILFVSAASGKATVGVKLDLLHKLSVCVKVNKVVSGTKNALDFQLVSELSAMAAEDPDLRYVIVSNDHGFDAAVVNLGGRGVQVTRIGTADIQKLCEDTVKVEPKAVKNTVASATSSPAVSHTPAGQSVGVQTAADNRNRVEEMLRSSGCPPMDVMKVTDCVLSCHYVPAGERKRAISERLRSVYSHSKWVSLYALCGDTIREAVMIA